MQKIRIKLTRCTHPFLNIITVTLLAFSQVKYAQSNNGQIVTNKDDLTQGMSNQVRISQGKSIPENSTQQDHIPQGDNIKISPDAYQAIHEFFQNTSDVSIQRYNQQLLQINIGARSFIASNDGRYIYAGKVIDTREKIDISEQITQKNRIKTLATLSNKNKLTFPATVKELYSVTMFTDIDCGYCRRFHNNMAQYNALGIRVNYLMFPRAGKKSESYNKTAAVLCSENPQEKITMAMQGRFPVSDPSIGKTCQQNLDQQMLVARKLGISATPTIVLPHGGIIEGALHPDKLLAQLKRSEILNSDLSSNNK
jgi:thiol:disulfide interchange protein DsbC